jgi:hypothetical protein
MTVRGVSGEAGIADYGVVIIGDLDDDWLSCDGASNDATRPSRPALAEVISVRGSAYACLSGDVPHAEVEVVGS